MTPRVLLHRCVGALGDHPLRIWALASFLAPSDTISVSTD